MRFVRVSLAEGPSACAEVFADVQDWPSFLRQAELYAVAPLLFDAVQQSGFGMPTQDLLSLRALVMRHRAAADARYQLMSELLPALSNAQIPVMALKGIALAPLVFERDDLRPMRDIDLLVPTEQQWQAGEVLRELGFELPEAQPSKFMRDTHQLPNATKTVGGFTISVEIHHDALSRDVPGHMRYADVESGLQIVPWRELEMPTLGHEQMLQQVCRHLSGLHPGAVLKLVNVLDVVLYAEKFRAEIDWPNMLREHPHVINTLRCLHYIVPLSAELQSCIQGVTTKPLNGVGESMQPLTSISGARVGFTKKLHMLFAPPDWWMHLYYNIDPARSLWLTKMLRHPWAVSQWIFKRLKSGALGG